MWWLVFRAFKVSVCWLEMWVENQSILESQLWNGPPDCPVQGSGMAHAANPSRHLFLYGPWAEMVFTLLDSWGENQKKHMNCDTWKLCGIHISVSRNKVLLAQSHTHLFTCHLWLLSWYHIRDRVAQKAESIDSLAPYRKSVSPSGVTCMVYRWGNWGPVVSWVLGNAGTWTGGFIVFIVSFNYQY